MRRAFAFALSAGLLVACDGRTERDVIATTGLAARYTFNGHARDVSGNGLHCTASGTAFTADRAGRENRAVLFDGTSFLDCGDVLNDLAMPFTLTAWVRMDRVNPYSTLLVSTDQSLVRTAGAALGLQDGVIGLQIGNGEPSGPGSRRTKASRASRLGQWMLLTGVVESAEVFLIYVDGVDVGGAFSGYGTTLASTADPMRLGAGLMGAMDEVRLYRRALTEAEIKTLALAK